MHGSALQNGKNFFDVYSPMFLDRPSRQVVEIGSQNVNGTLRDVCPKDFSYTGVDFIAGPGVDLILTDPYKIPLASDSVDIVLCSSCLEHSEFFWLTFLEMTRISKPDGLVYINAPSTGSFHRYPVDCWRFYPDSGKALASWARRNGYNCTLLESFIQIGGEFQDFVAVFLKDESQQVYFPHHRRMCNGRSDVENMTLSGMNTIQNFCAISQNDRKLTAINGIISEQLRVNI